MPGDMESFPLTPSFPAEVVHPPSGPWRVLSMTVHHFGRRLLDELIAADGVLSVELSSYVLWSWSELAGRPCEAGLVDLEGRQHAWRNAIGGEVGENVLLGDCFVRGEAVTVHWSPAQHRSLLDAVCHHRRQEDDGI